MCSGVIDIRCPGVGVCMFIATVPPGVTPGVLETMEGVPPGVFIPGVLIPPGVVMPGVAELGVAPGVDPTCGVSSQRDRRFPLGVIPGVSAPVRSVFGVSAQPGVRPGVSGARPGVSSQRFLREPENEITFF